MGNVQPGSWQFYVEARAMRVKQITVKGLFGSFDHTIALNMEDRITILHGLNGVGKTTLLSMIDAFFNKRFDELLYIDFSELLIDFDSSQFISIKVKSLRQGSPVLNKYQVKVGEFFFSDIDSEVYEYSLSIPKQARKKHLSNVLKPSETIEIPTELSLGILSGELMDFLVKSDREEEFSCGFAMETDIPAWLSHVTDSVDIHFIQYQRLLLDKSIAERKSFSSFNGEDFQNSIELYSKHLAGCIKDNLAHYGELSNRLDSSFPARVLEKSSSQELSEESLRSRVQELEKWREKLITNGLIKPDTETQFQLNLDESMDSGTKKVLSVYLEDVEKKLNVFDNIHEKINLFKEIINQKLLKKSMTVDPDKGLVFHTEAGHELMPIDLSSGEQHEIIMLYELLFNLKSNSLVLLDEPEISLHMAWKVEFLEDLVQIVKLSKIDVMIATHSASLIHDRWDLTVGLKG
ncbi:MAG: AAA family ATPase [Cyanobacteria bacterium P01_G01_bin.54]